MCIFLRMDIPSVYISSPHVCLLHVHFVHIPDCICHFLYIYVTLYVSHFLYRSFHIFVVSFVALCINKFTCISLQVFDPSECMSPLLVCFLWYIVQVYIALYVNRSVSLYNEYASLLCVLSQRSYKYYT